MIGEERSPRLGWQLGMAYMYLATDAWEIVMPSFQEFAVNSRRSLNRVVTTHGSNQITRLARKHGDAQTGRDESSKSSTTEIPDDANERRFQV